MDKIRLFLECQGIIFLSLLLMGAIQCGIEKFISEIKQLIKEKGAK